MRSVLKGSATRTKPPSAALLRAAGHRSPAARLGGEGAILHRWGLCGFGSEVIDEPPEHTLDAVDVLLAGLQILLHLVHHLLCALQGPSLAHELLGRMRRDGIAPSVAPRHPQRQALCKSSASTWGWRSPHPNLSPARALEGKVPALSVSS